MAVFYMGIISGHGLGIVGGLVTFNTACMASCMLGESRGIGVILERKMQSGR